MYKTKSEVTKALQNVLNKYADAGLAVDGKYGVLTDTAYKKAMGQNDTLPLATQEPKSEHFSLSEYYSNKIISGVKHRKVEMPPRKLWLYIQKSMDMLEKLRSALGDAKISISSGYRSPEYNAWLYENSNGGGVAKNSPHMRGTATDIVVSGKTPKQVYEVADKLFPDAGIGLYDSFVHIDWDIVLPNGNRRPARW